MPGSASIPAAGERKFAVIVFVDLTGYTELVRRLDPEVVTARIGPVISMMRQAIETVGGVVPSVAGDGFMAVFGVPTAMSDAAEAAISSAAAIRRAVSAANRTAGEVRVPDVHIGIAAGEVFVIPTDESTGWSLVGNAVNLASRLCDAAAADEVLLDEEFRRLAGLAKRHVAERHIAVRGVGEVAVWALDRLPVTSRLTASVPFVDRMGPQRDLDAWWEEVSSLGTARLVLVAGPSGMGKTRLVRHWLDSRGLPFTWAWCGAPARDPSLVNVARSLAADTAQPTEALELFDGTAAAVTPVRADPFPAVAAAARRIFEDATSEPRVLVLDDADRSDASLVDFLDDVRRQPLRGPLLMLATWRTDDARPPWAPDLGLEPLTDDDTRTLLDEAVGAPAPEAVAAAVVERAAGHPLMLVQSAAYLVESGAVVVEDGSCELRSPASLRDLPTSLRLFVAARIDRLTAAQKAALQELSTSGDAITDDVLRRVFRPSMTAAAEELRDAGLLRRTAEGWEFAHSIVQQVAYASIPRSARAELHRIQLAANDLHATGARMFHALHWAECAMTSGDAAPAEPIEAALAAVLEHGRALFASQAAAAYAAVRQAVPIIEDHGPLFPGLVADLQALAAMCLVEMGRFEEALAAADRALAAAGDAGESSRQLAALLVRGNALSRLRRVDDARETLEDALALAESTADARGEAQALRLLGDTWRHSSFPEFVSYVERAYATVAAAADATTAQEYAATLAYLTSIGPRDRYARWRTLATAGEPSLRAQLWLARAEAEAHRIRWEHEEAFAAAQETIRVSELLGATDGLADGLSLSAHAALGLGQLPAAQGRVERLRQLAVSTGNPRMRLMAAAVGATVHSRSAGRAEAQQELQHALDVVDGFGAGEMAEVFTAAAFVARDSGRWTEAADFVERAVSASATADFAVDVLSLRALAAGIQLELPRQPTVDQLQLLSAECRDADAPAVAAYVDGVADRLALLNGAARTPVLDELTMDESGIRADTDALAAELAGFDAASSWTRAVKVWEQLGTTVYLARAQARSGDATGATRTLDFLRADEAARQWAQRA
jgi:class 3 adenylate cyclase/tetratricopeptide (TPR) repeat protein